MPNLELHNRLYLNDGNGNFMYSAGGDATSTNLESVGVAAGDFDGDGDIDLYVANKFQGRANELLINDGSGNFTSVAGGDATFVAISSRLDCVVTCDLDGDGDLDIFVNGDPSVLFLNDGTGNFSEIKGVLSDNIPGPAVCFDATGNKHMDIWIEKRELNLHKGASIPFLLHTEAGDAIKNRDKIVGAIPFDVDGDGDMVR